MKKDRALPERVFEHGRWYRIAVANGQRREWHRLSPISEGLPALWRAYGTFTGADAGQYLMPALIADWEDEVLVGKSESYKTYAKHCFKAISADFAEFRPDEVGVKACDEFLSAWAHKPRSFNGYRSLLSSLFKFAMRKELRPLGTNPIDVIPMLEEKPRERCPSTSEIRRVKIGCLYGESGGRVSRRMRTRTGLTMAAFIEIAYLTGQDIGRLLQLRENASDDPNEPYPTDVGLSFRRSKTGGRVVIEWTPRLRAAVAALRRIKAERKLRKRLAERVEHDYLFTGQDGYPLTYEGFSNAWQRGLKRSGAKHFMARDIRARALTDKDIKEGRKESRKMSTHTTEGQLADYLRDKNPQHTKATA